MDHFSLYVLLSPEYSKRFSRLVFPKCMSATITLLARLHGSFLSHWYNSNRLRILTGRSTRKNSKSEGDDKQLAMYQAISQHQLGNHDGYSPQVTVVHNGSNLANITKNSISSKGFYVSGCWSLLYNTKIDDYRYIGRGRNKFFFFSFLPWSLVDVLPQQSSPSTETCWCHRPSNLSRRRISPERSQRRASSWSYTLRIRWTTWLFQPKEKFSFKMMVDLKLDRIKLKHNSFCSSASKLGLPSLCRALKRLLWAKIDNLAG